MKGQREAPQCGFSARVVELLDHLLPDYETVDVLSDPAIREGIKTFSSWPTIPQLYVRGGFVGGCDIVMETFASGELHETLGVARDEAQTPSLTIEAAAAEQLRIADREAPSDLALRLSVDARYRTRVLLAPPDADDVEVEASGVTLRLDPLSAQRAEGARIDLVRTARGAAFRVSLPNAPGPAAA